MRAWKRSTTSYSDCDYVYNDDSANHHAATCLIMIYSVVIRLESQMSNRRSTAAPCPTPDKLSTTPIKYFGILKQCFLAISSSLHMKKSKSEPKC